MISDKKAIGAAEIIVKYCMEQQTCQNCIFRKYGCAQWDCTINAPFLRDVIDNVKAKIKHGGYI